MLHYLKVYFFSTINYLSGKSLTDSRSRNNYIEGTDFKFVENRFETDIVTGKLGTTDTFIADLKIEHDKLTQQYEQLQKNFEEEKKKPTFGCPAKFVRVNLEIDGKEKSVDFIEAIYRITHKIVSRSLFGEQGSVASKSDTEKVFAA